MDKVGGLTQVLAALRKQLNNSAQQVAKSDKSQKASRKKRLTQRSKDNTCPLDQLLIERIAPLPADTSPRDLRQVFIKTVLSRELEAELLSEEEITRITDNINKQIENNNLLKSKFETLINQIRRGKTSHNP